MMSCYFGKCILTVICIYTCLCLQEKAKYEVVTGMLKEGEGMVEFWDDLLNRYPSVIALIDPMRKQVSLKLNGDPFHKLVVSSWKKIYMIYMICDLAILVRERRLRWFGHVMRSNGEINRVQASPWEEGSWTAEEDLGRVREARFESMWFIWGRHSG